MARRFALVAGLAHVLLATSAAAVRADAFLEKPGEGKMILLAGFDGANQYWTRHGRLIPITGYRKFNLSAFAELGVDAQTTMIVRSDADLSYDAWGLKLQAAGGVGARRLLYETGALRVAAQAVVSVGSGLEGMPDRFAGAALDARLAAAVTFSVMQMPAFVDVSGGPRVAIGDWRGARLDATLGVRFADKWLVLLQSYNRFNAPGPLGARARAHKAQAGVVYDFARQWSVIAGAFTTPSARAEPRQHGVVTGLMRRF